MTVEEPKPAPDKVKSKKQSKNNKKTNGKNYLKLNAQRLKKKSFHEAPVPPPRPLTPPLIETKKLTTRRVMVRQATTTITLKNFDFFACDEENDAAISEGESDESDDSDSSSPFESESRNKTPEPEEPKEEPLSPAALKR